MALQEILNALADRTPFVTEAQRDEIKAKIANLGSDGPKDSESSETTETATEGNAEGTTKEAGTTEVIGTTEPPAPETPPATEVGLGIVPEPAANVEADNSEGTPPAEAPVATDPSLGILPESSVEPADKPGEDTAEVGPDDETSHLSVETTEVSNTEPVEPITDEHGATSAGVSPEANPTEGTAGESGSGSEGSNVGS